MRIRAITGSVLAGLVLAFSTVAPALADEPVDLGSAPVRDAAGVLENPAAAEAAIDAAFDRTGVSLFVVLVDTFESPTDADAWTDATAQRNGLGADDVLLAIAVDDRTYSLSADVATLDDGQYDAILSRVEQSLRDGDWDGAVVGAAESLADQLDPPFPVVPVAIGAGVVVLGGLVAGGVALGRRRRASAATRASAKDLDTRAGSLLVQLDDAVKTSEQELGFALAQFGEEATAPFRASLEAAKAQVKEAFELRHRLDDAQPETPEERRALTLRIIELCEAADAALDARADQFDELRALEKNAPQLLESVGAEQAALAARIEGAEAAVADLASRFGAPAVDAIDDNPGQARKLASFAGTSLTTAREALAAGQAGQAAIAVRAAQQAVGQVAQLLAAIDAAAAELPRLSARLEAAIADTRSDLAEARTADPAALAPVIAESERVLDAAARQDPATALAAVEQANAVLDRELSALRDRQAQLARAATQLDRVTAEARAAVDAAREYITTRRGAVGADARTRLAEAENLLTRALTLAATDAVAALAAAQQSARLAGSALALARSDVSSFDSPARDRPSAGPDWGSAVLGGILGGMLSGSGSSSGWIGGGRRPSGRSGRSGGFGGFGGFGGSSRRSSGSIRRSSSSGRRSRGGRF